MSGPFVRERIRRDGRAEREHATAPPPVATADDSDRDDDFEVRLGAWFATGLAVFVLGGLLLATFRLLRLEAVVPLLIGGIVVFARAAPRPRQFERVALLPLTSLAVLLTVLVLMQVLMTSATWSPWRGFTAWYYWGTAKQVADLGAFPSTVIEWGGPVAFDANYLSFTSTSAIFEMLSPLGLVAGMQVFRLLVLVLAISGLWMLFGRVVREPLRFGATLLFFSSALMLFKFGAVRPEALGLAFGAWGLWCVDVWMVRGERQLGIVGGILIGLTALAHAPALVATGLGAVALLTYRFVDRGGGRHTLLRFAAAMGGGAGLYFVVTTVVTALLGGSIFFIELFRAPAEVAPSVSGVDETYLLLQEIRNQAYGTPPSWNQLVSGRVFTPWGGTLGIGALLLLFAVALPASAFPPRHQRTAVAAALALVALGGVLAALSFMTVGAETYVPRRTGATRVAPYVFILLLLSPVAVTSLARGPWRSILGSGLLVVAVALSVSSYRDEASLPAFAAPEGAMDELYEVRGILGEHESRRVVTNYYTEGSVRTILESDGLLDGRLPYSNAELRARSLDLLNDVKLFLGRNDCDAVRVHEPDFVLIAEPDVIGHHGPYRTTSEITARADAVLFDGEYVSLYDFRILCGAGPRVGDGASGG